MITKTNKRGFFATSLVFFAGFIGTKIKADVKDVVPPTPPVEDNKPSEIVCTKISVVDPNTGKKYFLTNQNQVLVFSPEEFFEKNENTSRIINETFIEKIR